jgi:hypothetical protein
MRHIILMLASFAMISTLPPALPSGSPAIGVVCLSTMQSGLRRQATAGSGSL